MASSSSPPTVDQLSHQLRNTSLEDSNRKKILTQRDIIKADRLIRELHVYAESKKRGTKAKNRNLVYGNKFELPLYNPNKPTTHPATTTSSSTSTAQASTSGSNPLTAKALTDTITTTADKPSTKSHNGLSHAEKTKLKKEQKAQKEQMKLEEAANTTTPAPARDDIMAVTSWKMNEFEFSTGLLPTLARGLFTYEDTTAPAPVHKPPVAVPEDAIDETAPVLESGALAKGTHRILIRGYDKFFNIGEVEKTELTWLATQTEGPYEVTLKENGCIIFMAGLPPQLAGPEGGCIVSSKHFLGSLDQALSAAPGAEKNDNLPEVSHSAKGREWLEKSLSAKGKTLQEFGRWLYDNNLTAVAELCDDSFEEHVLEYPADKAGLYLHGLNLNTADFQTMPSGQVQQVAKEWGLWPTDYVTFNTQKEVMDFADKVRNAGEYDNRAVEGFVVRCKTKNTGGQTHFFKIKYDEPYLMYREWREVTKNIWAQKLKREKEEALAAAKNKGKDTTTSAAGKSKKEPEEPRKLRMRYPLTKSYVEFILPLMKDKPELFANYNKNQGIIAIRDMFLKQWNAKPQAEQEQALAASQTSATVASAGAVEDFQRTVIIPIATIGCGKTTVSVALVKLFGWAHVSSDDFQHLRKNPGQKFTNEVVNQLKKHTVVIADRNNHEYLHRERIMNCVREQFPKTRFVALYWSHDELPIAQIREMHIDRVKKRGNNHQNLTPEFCPEFEFVIQKFLKGFVPLNTFVEPDSQFSVVVETKVGEDSLKTVEKVVKEFAIPTLGAGGVGNHAIPTDKEIEEAVRYAREEWKPKRVLTGEAEQFFKQKQASVAEIKAPEEAVAAAAKVKKAREPKYFGVLLESGAVLRFLNEQFDIETTNTTTTTTTTNNNNNNTSSASKAVEHITGPKTDKQWIQLHDQLLEWKDENRVGPSQHVTVVHTSARNDPWQARAEKAEKLWKQYMDEMASITASPSTSPQDLTQKSGEGEDDGFKTVCKKPVRNGKRPSVSAATTAASSSPSSLVSSAVGTDQECTVIVDSIVWTKRIVVLRVSNLKRTGSGKAIEHTQPQLHITVGTVNDMVKPYESNEVLKQLASSTKRPQGGNKDAKKDGKGAASAAGSEVLVIKLQKPKVFTGVLRSMMW
ncbi:hypothetical protein BGZ82_001274 [Podila clonocystis]|nr:hypothetical protein BGZ82_001274 [Podila clonocystis]